MVPNLCPSLALETLQVSLSVSGNLTTLSSTPKPPSECKYHKLCKLCDMSLSKVTTFVSCCQNPLPAVRGSTDFIIAGEGEASSPRCSQPPESSDFCRHRLPCGLPDLSFTISCFSPTGVLAVSAVQKGLHKPQLERRERERRARGDRKGCVLRVLEMLLLPWVRCPWQPNQGTPPRTSAGRQIWRETTCQTRVCVWGGSIPVEKTQPKSTAGEGGWGNSNTTENGVRHNPQLFKKHARA